MSKSDFRHYFEGTESIFNVSRPIRGQENAKINQKHNFGPTKGVYWVFMDLIFITHYEVISETIYDFV